MRQFIRKKRKVSNGERARALAFFIVGICSATLGYIAVLHLDSSALLEPMSRYQTWIVVAAGLGGMIALFLAGDRLGQPGPRGALHAVAGAIWVTFIGALIGGTLSLPVYGTMFGPFIVCVTLFGAPVLSMLWAFNLTSVHILMRIYQRERDSIFVPAPTGTSTDDYVVPFHLRSRFS